MSTLYDCPLHYNLLETALEPGKMEWSPIRLLARSDKFVFKGSTKPGQHRYIAPEKLASRLEKGVVDNRNSSSEHPQTKTGLSLKDKVVIGVVVPIVTLLFLIGGVWRLWWIPRKRKQLAEKKEGASDLHEMPTERKDSADQRHHELDSEGNRRVLEGDYDNYIRELDAGNPIADDLNGHYRPTTEAEGTPMQGYGMNETVPKIRIDSPK
jgi:hypothetical protein